jgi:hypothetical protein
MTLPFRLLLTFLALLPAVARAEDCRLFLLHRQAAGVALERLDVASGERTRLTMGAGSEWITFVLPLSAGKSADLIQAAAGPAELVADCGADGLTVSVRRQNGQPRALPPVRLAELESYDLRVSVRPGVGSGQVFAVRGGTSITPADGPVLDLFGGRIPLAPGDYAVTLEASAASARPASAAVSGRAPLVFDGEHAFVRGGIDGGVEGWWVVDLAAGRSVVVHSALPAGLGVTPVSSVEYSAQGARQSAGEMQGLGGAARGFLGAAEVPRISVGSLRFAAADVNVVSALPRVGDRPIVGILGLDLLMRAPVVHLDYAAQGELSLGAQGSSGGSRVTFTIADRHVFLAARIGARALSLVLDSGAKVSLLAPETAATLGLVAGSDGAVEIRGLDGAATLAPSARVGELRIDGQTFADVTFHLAPLPALGAWGAESAAGILGNDFLRRFAAIELDFARREVCFLPPG